MDRTSEMQMIADGDEDLHDEADLDADGDEDWHSEHLAFGDYWCLESWNSGAVYSNY